MKPDKRRFRLSKEARGLIADGSGRWEHVELADGPAAQKMVPGVKAKAPPREVVAPEPEADERDPNTLDLLESNR